MIAYIGYISALLVDIVTKLHYYFQNPRYLNVGNQNALKAILSFSVYFFFLLFSKTNFQYPASEHDDCI